MTAKIGGEVEGREEKGRSNRCLMMKTIICSWNLKGLGRVEKKWGIRDLLKRWKVDLFTIQNSKLRGLKKG